MLVMSGLADILGDSPVQSVGILILGIVTGIITLMRIDRSLLKEQNQILTDQNEALRAGHLDDQEEIRQLKGVIAECNENYAGLEGRVRALTEFSSQLGDWKQAIALMTGHNKQVEERWKLEDERVNEALGILRILRDREAS